MCRGVLINEPAKELFAVGFVYGVSAFFRTQGFHSRHSSLSLVPKQIVFLQATPHDSGGTIALAAANEGKEICPEFAREFPQQGMYAARDFERDSQKKGRNPTCYAPSNYLRTKTTSGCDRCFCCRDLHRHD
jgi:hypothetical protein